MVCYFDHNNKRVWQNKNEHNLELLIATFKYKRAISILYSSTDMALFVKLIAVKFHIISPYLAKLSFATPSCYAACC